LVGVRSRRENTLGIGHAQQGANDEAYDDFVGMPGQHAAMKGSAGYVQFEIDGPLEPLEPGFGRAMFDGTMDRRRQRPRNPTSSAS
jgi:hypothetical protein